jgi:pyridoxal phosphate enzyme (YggS family)
MKRKLRLAAVRSAFFAESQKQEFCIVDSITSRFGRSVLMSISKNIASIRERIAAAARRANRNQDEIALMAVTKTFLPARIREAYEAGLRLFGENRVQEFAGKSEALRDLRDDDWHMIGHLQSNKALKAAELFSAIDSVDSLRLAQRLDAAAEQLGKKLPVLIEISIAGESTKSGVSPESKELEQLLQSATELRHLHFRGLMTVPPFSDDPEEARRYFRKLRLLRDAIAGRDFPGVSMEMLSMGMSHDFEVAIEEGSTCVRLGTAIFGNREQLRTEDA